MAENQEVDHRFREATQKDLLMANGWSTWDIVLWLVLAFVGVNLLLQVMLRFRAAWISRFQDEIQQSRKRTGGDGRSPETDGAPSARRATRP